MILCMALILLPCVSHHAYGVSPRSVAILQVPMSESFPLLHDVPGHDHRWKWYHYIPLFGQIAHYRRQLDLENALVNQAIERGPVPESAWAPYTYNEAIRRKIEEIVIESAYPKGSTFHPLDPVELMFVLRYGDLNEVMIMMDIEEELGFKVDDKFPQLIEEQTTFIDFIKMVESATGS